MGLTSPWWAHSSDYIFLGGVTINGDRSVIYMDGHIGKNTWAHFEDRIKAGGVRKIVLNSPGGYVT